MPLFTIGLITFIIFLLVLAITSMPILVLLRDGKRPKRVIIILGVEVILSLIGFYIMYISTFAPRDFASGGDPLLIWISPIVIGVFINSFILLILLVYKMLFQNTSNKTLYLYSLIILLTVIVCGFMEYRFSDQLLYDLNSFNNPNTNISLNPNTTSLYFNLYTFIGLYGISSLIGLFLKLSVRTNTQI